MPTTSRIEQALVNALAFGDRDPAASACPPRLHAAIQHAVFPGGARIRPQLCLAVAAACGDDAPHLTDAAAAAIELLHCASLVHDDLPCFDDAPIRRGKPSVHVAFGEQLAVLAGDALIVQAFQALAAAVTLNDRAAERLPNLLTSVGRGVGAPHGIVAGQAWECEPQVPLAEYQRAKTGALFAAATEAGAAAAGAEYRHWRQLGARLGEAFQVADDIRDVACTAEELGKPVGQDQTHDRPSAAHSLGIDGAIKRLERLVEEAVAAIPPCPGAEPLRQLVRQQARSFLPKKHTRRAA